MKVPATHALTPLTLARLAERALHEKRSRSWLVESLLSAALNPVQPDRAPRRNDTAPHEACSEVGTRECVWPHLCGKDGLCWLQEGAKERYEGLLAEGAA